MPHVPVDVLSPCEQLPQKDAKRPDVGGEIHVLSGVPDLRWHDCQWEFGACCTRRADVCLAAYALLILCPPDHAAAVVITFH